MKVGLCVIATGEYGRFLPGLLTSAAEFFCPGHEVTCYLHTDQPPSVLPATRLQYVHRPTLHQPWPAPSLYRYHLLLASHALLATEDYVFYCDVDMRFVRPVESEIFGELVATRHYNFCEVPRARFTYEGRPESRAYIQPTEGEHYFAGAFQGGSAAGFLAAMETMRAAIDDDAHRGITATWHDESHWNRYCVDHRPARVLTHHYCCPVSWCPESQRLVLVDKNYAEVRAANRILVGVMSAWQHAERRERCSQTWLADARHCGIDSVFVLGALDAARCERRGDMLFVPAPNRDDMLPQRMRWFCRWALTQPGWDYLFKCNDETYVAAARLGTYGLQGRNYIGAEWKPGVGYGSGGGGYFLSRRAVTLVAERLTCATGYEDQLVGEVLREAGFALSVEPRLVPLGSALVRPRKDNDLITVHGVATAVFEEAHLEMHGETMQLVIPQPSAAANGHAVNGRP